MISLSSPLSKWPWASMGNYKYCFSAPILAFSFYGNSNLYKQLNTKWNLHILIIMVLRYAQQQLWIICSRLHWIVKYKIRSFGIGFKQVDREFHCDDSDDYIIFQAIFAFILGKLIPSLENLPNWNREGYFYVALFHMGATEPLYYLAHRLFHKKDLFSRYHFLHHKSTTLEPSTASTHTFIEEMWQVALMGVALLGATLLRRTSISIIYAYVLMFDFLKQMGHCNTEFVPTSLFKMLPFLKLLVYTPSYHHLHHQHTNSNFCLFMPLYDALGGTMHTETHTFHVSCRQGNPIKRPDFVFLIHGVDISSSIPIMHALRTASSMPYRWRWFYLFLWPTSFVFLIVSWALGIVFVIHDYEVRGVHAQIWVVPRMGFQYFLPFGAQSINNIIEGAILDANQLGVKVIALGALNKNESLNGGGILFTKRNENLKVRVVHGNTLTTAAILNEVPQATKEVFLTGATSKLGRALALHLCRKHIRVLMLTSSQDRFKSILEEAPVACQSYLIHVTNYQAGKDCKRWILGKWASERDQNWAPQGAHFHQFVVPPSSKYREDCTYGDMVGMRLPIDTRGLHFCEYVLPRGVIAACHAGGLVHALEGWKYHEVGTINVDDIDKTWEAAMRHGLAPM